MQAAKPAVGQQPADELEILPQIREIGSLLGERVVGQFEFLFTSKTFEPIFAPLSKMALFSDCPR